MGAAFLTPVVITPLDLQAQSIFGGTVFLMCVMLSRSRTRMAAQLLIAVSIAISSRYLFWRITRTVGADGVTGMILGGLLLMAEIYAYLVLVLGHLVSGVPYRRRPVPLPNSTDDWPTVDIYIPTYNEPLSLVRATVLAAQAIDWPSHKKRVYILDDGKRDEFRVFAAEARVGYLRRPDNTHAKAGNLNHALRKTDGEFVAVFDCDHIPTRSFLQMTMGWFLVNDRLAVVQTPHHFYSPGPFERNLGTFRSTPNEEELFYGLIQPGNDLYDATFFCGSCAVLRRSALDEIGGFAVETVTEDAHTALKLHRKGYSSAYLAIPQASGLATESLSVHVGQRIRWARGMTQIFRLDNPLFGRGLKLMQRLCYLSAMIHFMYGLPRLVFLTAPLFFLVFGAHVFNAEPLLVLAYALPHLFHAVLTNARLQGRYRHSFWAEIYETTLAWYVSIPTLLTLLSPRAGSFNVTAKGGLIRGTFFDKVIARPYVVLWVANAVGLGVAGWMLATGREALDVVLINGGWAIYNLVILSCTLAVAWETRQVRKVPRIGVRLPAMVRLPSERTVRCETLDVSLTGASLRMSDSALEEGDFVWMALYVRGQEQPLPARVITTNDEVVRVRFEPLTLQEESGLVQAVFSRADAWLSWSKTQREDQPIREALRIAGFGARMLRRTLTGAGRGI